MLVWCTICLQMRLGGIDVEKKCLRLDKNLIYP